MQAKLEALFSGTKTASNLYCVLEVQAKGMAIILLKGVLPEATIISMDYLPLSAESDAVSILGKFIKQKQFQGAQCACVLSEHYRLLFLDPPKVPEAEWRQAVPWLCKDLLTAPMADTAIDAFPVPFKGNEEKKLYAVIAPKAPLLSLQLLVHEAGLTLTSISIAELAYAALLSKISPDAISSLLFGQLKFMVASEGLVGLSRQVADVKDGPLEADKLSQIPDEIQRSLDFYQSHLSDQLPLTLYLLPNIAQQADLLTLLEERIYVPIRPLPEESLWPESIPLDSAVKEKCLLVYSETLRLTKQNRTQNSRADEGGQPS